MNRFGSRLSTILTAALAAVLVMAGFSTVFMQGDAWFGILVAAWSYAASAFLLLDERRLTAVWCELNDQSDPDFEEIRQRGRAQGSRQEGN